LEGPLLSANKAYRDHQNIAGRARLRGLATKRVEDAEPRLPVEVLERILHDAEAELANESSPTRHLFLGRW
jgi:hypothetical protein